MEYFEKLIQENNIKGDLKMHPILNIMQHSIDDYKGHSCARLEFSIQNNHDEEITDINGVFYIDVKNRDYVSYNGNAFQNFNENILNVGVKSLLQKFQNLYQEKGMFWYGFHYTVQKQEYTFNCVNYSDILIKDLSPFINLAAKHGIEIDLNILNSERVLTAIQFSNNAVKAFKLYMIYEKHDKHYGFLQSYISVITKIFPKYKYNGFHILYRFHISGKRSKKIIFHLLSGFPIMVDSSNIKKLRKLGFSQRLLAQAEGKRIIAIAFEKSTIELYFDILH